MSVPNQQNGKKSSNSSIANTPSSTPVTTSNGNAQAVIHNSPPPNNNAPKYGTLVPNRIFVGGISANTTEGELLQLFSSYGTVKAAKIIQDRAGVSKGYGFITFESEDDAQRPLREADNIVLRERKLNIAPAVKKQLSFPQPFNFNRAFDGSSPTTVAVGNPPYFLPPTMPYFQSGVSYYPASAPVPGDPNAQQPVYQPPPVYPAQTGPPQAATYPSMMFPAQTIYMPQQYPMAMPYEYGYYTNNGAPTQYMVGAQGGPGPQGPPMPPSGSPPRPPCYNQQVSYASEPVFYNMPMYGGPMDHPPVYTEPIETGANYTEEPFMGQCIPQDLDARYNTRSTPCDSTTPVGEQHAPHNIAPSNNVPSSSSARFTQYSAVAEQQQHQQHHHHQHQHHHHEADTTRQTNTPVVSLLSIDNSLEKDLNAMQGGRKKKPLAPLSMNAPAVFTAPIMNGLPPVAFPFNYPPPPLNCHPPFTAPYPPFMPNPPQHQFNNVPQNQFDYGQQVKQQANKTAQTNGYAKKPTPRRNYGAGGNRQNDNSNGSSLRTDSSSSAASCADENGRLVNNNNNNDEKHRTTGVNTPPPAPYSPLTNHGYAMRYNGVTSPPNGQYNGPRRNYHNGHAQYDGRKTGAKPRTNGSRTNVARESTDNTNSSQYRGENNVVNAIYDTNQPQVHTGSSSNFAPLPTRRNRRSIRRSNMGTGAALSEIGAGDAPLPQNSDSVSEACKKMDSLKL